MKSIEAGNLRCCVGRDRCEGSTCMAWMSDKEGENGQCLWMVLSNMVIKVLAGFMPRIVR